MSKDLKIRWGWLKGMYIYTIFFVGILGVGMIVIPERMKSILNWPVEEPIAFGIIGSIYLSSALLSILGLRSPLKFVPVLLLQLCYKLIWFIGVVLPLLVNAKFPSYAREEGKLYCEFDAKDAESIRQVLAKANKIAGELPTEGIYKLDLMVNSEDFR